MDGLTLGGEALSFWCRPHSKDHLPCRLRVQSENIRIGFTNRPFFGSAKGLGEPPWHHSPSSEACTFTLSEFHSEVATSGTSSILADSGGSRGVLDSDPDPGCSR
jgi:hypothetical protein